MARNRVKTTDTDPGFKKAKKNAEGKEVVVVGILGGANSEIATYAGTQEYGTTTAGPNKNITIPERSFLRSMLDERKKRIGKILQAATAQILLGGISKRATLKALGVRAQGWVQLKIRTGPFTPNAPSTIAAKGSSSPLIDTSTMRKAVSSEVRRKGLAPTGNK